MEADIKAVRRTAARWAEAIDRGDLEALAALMADDVVVVHGNGRILEGRQAVLSDLLATLRDYRVALEISFEETIVDANLAFDRATIRTTVTPRAGGKTSVMRSRTFTLLRRAPAGSWTIARTIGVIIGG